ncbi:MAG: hypothetical protein ACYCXK_06115 [Candidatus Humimicrobiaceae bacterium]
MKNMRKKIFTLIIITFIISLFIPFSNISASSAPEVYTRHSDYKPDHKVMICGTDFVPNEVYSVEVIRPDGSVVKGDGSFEFGIDTITSDNGGAFKYKYQLAEVSDSFNPEGTYTVSVFDSSGNFVAGTTFTDSTVRW